MKKCSDCVYAIIRDYGYSNYTVEGSDVYCSKSLNPNAPFDRWYGEDKRDLFAEQCDSFKEGYPVEIEVDWSGDYTDYFSKYVSASDIKRVLE